jgi:hypothetical protein
MDNDNTNTNTNTNKNTQKYQCIITDLKHTALNQKYVI